MFKSPGYLKSCKLCLALFPLISFSLECKIIRLSRSLSGHHQLKYLLLNVLVKFPPGYSSVLTSLTKLPHSLRFRVTGEIRLWGNGEFAAIFCGDKACHHIVISQRSQGLPPIPPYSINISLFEGTTLDITLSLISPSEEIPVENTFLKRGSQQVSKRKRPL